METEEEENSNLHNPSHGLGDESNITSTNTTATTVAENSEAKQHELPDSEPRCETEPVTDSNEPELAAENNTSPPLPSPSPPPQAETTVPERCEDQDALAGGGAGESLPPPSLSPQQPVVEEGGDEAAGARDEMDEVEPPLQPLEEEAVEEDGDLIRGEESHRVINNNEDANAGGEDPVVNVEIQTETVVVTDAAQEVEAEPRIKKTDEETEAVANVEEELEADTVNKEIKTKIVLEKEALADVVEEMQPEDVNNGVGAEKALERKAVADVEEELELESVSKEMESVTALDSEAVDKAEVLEAETVNEGVEAETAMDEKVTNEAEDEKAENINRTEMVEQMKENETDMETEVEDEEVEKLEDADQPEEMEATEQIEITGAAKEAVNEAEEIDEMDMADETEEGDKEEEMEVGEEEEEKENEAEETEMTEETAEAEEEVEEMSRSAGGKRKRGKNAKAPAKATSRKKMEEDVCFICFDGGELVLCDRRGCPKAYHPSCVNRDEAFFRSKGRWNCGWHLCSNCEKNAHYMCYTCTFSLCKGCIKDGVILCVRGNKGFCETCMKTIMMIEENEQGNKEMAQVDFDDKSSWEFLFKDYWVGLKERLSLTLEELSQAKHPWKGSELRSGKQETPEDVYDAQNDGGSASDSSEHTESATPKKRKAKKRLKSRAKEKDSPSTSVGNWEDEVSDESVEWASKELLEFVMHMKNGDRSICSQFDVQALLLDYIKRNKLRDPRRKSQIICDSRLENLFGKPRVGHFEMLKLLESHFLLKDDAQADDLQGTVVDIEANQFEADENSDAFVKSSKDKRRKSRKKGDRRGLQSNVDDYAAIDTHNINLIYLRRSLVEELIEDTDTFNEKVVGSFVRIRISGNAQKQDLYRLVQVVGTTKAAEPYRVGKKMANCLLEILNLNKTEVVSMDIISNQEFTEDECKRLRQSIKCGLINRLTVGDIQEKAMALQAVRVVDALETEITRITHLRDRASDMGRRKELRECVEKLQLLKSPEERQRRLEEIPEIHTDPKMDPSYESEEDEDDIDDKKQENYLRPRGSSFSRRGREPTSPRLGATSPHDSWAGTRNYSSMNRELSRNMSSKGFSNKTDDAVGAVESVNESLRNMGRDGDMQQLQSWEKPKSVSNSEMQGARSMQISEPVPRAKPDVSPTPSSVAVTQSAAKINETDKIWHYRDPSGKIQGPFSMVQLRKWNNTGYFPVDLRIWKTTEKQDDSILLTDALKGNFQKETPQVDTSFLKTQLADALNQPSPYSAHTGESRRPHAETGNPIGQAAVAPVQVPSYSADRWGSETNLPSPTPSQTPKGGTRGKTYESRWSPTPAQPAGPVLAANALSGGSGELRRPALAVPENDQFAHTLSSSTKLSGHSDSINLSPGVRMVPKAETGMHLGSGNAAQVLSQLTVQGESPRVQVNSHLHVAPSSNGPSVNAIVDTNSLQNMVQPGNNPLVGSHGWAGGSISRPEMSSMHSIPASGSQVWGNTPVQKLEPSNSISTTSQPGAYVNWGSATSSIQNSASSFAGHPNTGWGPIPGHSTPSFIPDNPTNAPRQGTENQTTGWGPIPGNPNVNLGGSLPSNPYQGWAASSQGSTPANANQGWVAPGQGQRPGITNPGFVAPVQGQATTNAFPGWVPPGQGSAPFTASQAWVPAGQGPPSGNASSGWTAPNSNMGQRGSDMNHNGDRFSGQKDRASHGGDSGHGGGKQWNRQSSFSRGDPSKSSFKGQRVCKFHENGHCKKGAQCDYMHS